MLAMLELSLWLNQQLLSACHGQSQQQSHQESKQQFTVGVTAAGVKAGVTAAVTAAVTAGATAIVTALVREKLHLHFIAWCSFPHLLHSVNCQLP